ncbi:MAG: hypothetical protein ACYC39_12350 [Thiobacillus sp.]|jgi:hypothetical protein|nr:hypothetical protein [Gammaproteobacteria bacterium]HQT34366.1 hypothetical protein [Thiobacillus sp.]
MFDGGNAVAGLAYNEYSARPHRQCLRQLAPRPQETDMTTIPAVSRHA